MYGCGVVLSRFFDYAGFCTACIGSNDVTAAAAAAAAAEPAYR
jgi:hypothetical protein